MKFLKRQAIQSLGYFLIPVACMTFSISAQAEPQDINGQTPMVSEKKPTSESSSKEANLPALNLKTILLDKPTREKIDKQRAAYLNPQLESEQEIIQPPPKKTGMDGKPKKKGIYLPYQLSVTAVVKKPDGSALVRIDNKYNLTKSKHIYIDQTQTGPEGVLFSVAGKEKLVPVGQTLYPRSMKTTDNYVIEQQKKKEALPKTKDKATENRLKEVQILTAE